MRALRTSLAAAWLWGLIPALASAQTPEALLNFKPTQPGVDYDIPADRAAIEACKVEKVTDAQKNVIGYALRDGQGKLLRKFISAKAANKGLDQWSYYQQGFEVYRDVDLDDNRTVDECQWLNMAGTRIGVVEKDKIKAWKRLSAEEASKVLVQSLVAGDLATLETVMATPEELAALGVPKSEVERARADAGKRTDQVRALLKELKGWDKQTAWSHFDGKMPHVIPADPGTELKGDLILYENAVVFVGLPNGQGDPSKFAFLQVPEMVKVGETWKFVDLPRAVDPQKPVAAVAADGGIRAALFRGEADAAGAAQDPKLVAALQALGQYDTKHGAVMADGGKQKLAEFYIGRIPLLREVIKLSPDADEKLIYNKQIADSLAAAYQTGLYPNGLDLLDALGREGGKVASYAAYRKLMAENAQKADEPGANPIALQKDLLAKLEGFLATHGRSDEAPEVLLQLASFNEFNLEEDEARKFYGRLTSQFPDSEPGKKAAGALRRLDLVGKPISLKGTGLRGETVDAASARGKTLLVTFWATWANPAKNEMAELQKVYQKNRAQGFEIIAVDLDNDKAALEAFLKDNPLPWPQIFEPGGMDSRLADEFGIISLPTMILVDPQGTVVNRNIRTAAELEKQMEKLGAEKAPQAALAPR